MTPLKEEPNVAQTKRLHNLELLRIIAMLMVLFIHYNLPVRGIPSPETLQADPSGTMLTIVLQSVLIVCVNCFILISGWFGIRWKRRSFLNLCFQVFFWAVICYPILLLLPHSSADSVLLYLQGLLGKWFVWAYFGLYLFAPVFNDFIEKSDVRRLSYFVLAFYLFSTLFGYLSKAVADFNEGMSVLSLIGLYLLGAWLRKVETSLPKRPLIWLSGYLGCIIVLTLLSVLLFSLGIQSMPHGYLNPIVIVESVCLFMFFQRMQVNAPVILFFSSSAYAVYLIHVFPGDCYATMLQRIVNSDFPGWAEAGAIVVYILLVFVVAVLVDKIRISMFRRLMP